MGGVLDAQSILSCKAMHEILCQPVLWTRHFLIVSFSHLQLCTILNNMYHVKKTLSTMPVTLKLESYYSWLEEECNELGTKVRLIAHYRVVIIDN